VNQRFLAFANNTLALEWEGGRSQELVNFLFAAVPDAPVEQAIVTLHLADAGGSQISLDVHGAEEWSWSGEMGEMALYLMERACYFLADGSRGGALFHAACLCREGNALLLPGGSGSGKSMLSAWLALNGWHFCGDELAFIPAGGYECQALTRPLHLKRRVEQFFPGLVRKGALAVGSGWLVLPQALGEILAGEPPVLKQIIFPSYQAGAASELQLLTRASTATTLTGLMINARNLPENGFPEVLRLARNIPAYRLVYSDFEQLRRIFNSSPNLIL
jgi:hypothetical protein